MDTIMMIIIMLIMINNNVKQRLIFQLFYLQEKPLMKKIYGRCFFPSRVQK